MKRVVSSAAAAGLLAFALAACSTGGQVPDSSPEGPGETSNSMEQPQERAGNVFDFDLQLQSRGEDSSVDTFDGSVEIVPSEGLKAALPEGARLANDSVKIAAKAFPNGLCRINYEIKYTNGGLESLREMAQKREERFAQGKDWEARVELAEIMPVSLVNGFQYDKITYSDNFPDDDVIEAGTYVSNDGTRASVVGECNETDPLEGSVAIWYPLKKLVDGMQHSPFQDDLGTAHISVYPSTTGGDPFIVVEGRVRAEVTNTGEWAPKKWPR